jgi:hypothetical protein
MKEILKGKYQPKDVQYESEDSDIFVDGLRVRWQFHYKEQSTKRNSKWLCCKKPIQEAYKDDQELTNLNESLYMRLQKQQRAIRNWNTLKVFLAFHRFAKEKRQ